MSTVEKKSEGRVLLPHTIVPNRYDIKLEPNLSTFTFNGEVTILLTTSDDLDADCKQIVMHAKELCFISASFVEDKVGASKVEAEEVRWMILFGSSYTHG
jgi:hypothetical protein